MPSLDIIQLVLAAWGAGLATYLGIRELRKESRRIRIFLDHVHWVERHQLIVVNIGHRPVTITDVGIRVTAKDPGIRNDPEMSRPIGPARREDGTISPRLPAVLTDGQSLTFLLDEQADSYLHSEEFTFIAFAHDAENREYSTKKMRAYDAKYEHYVRE